MILPVYKQAGLTPLQALEELRRERPELRNEPMVYAGRLDPMAEGLLLVLTGDDRFSLPEHLAHDKDYLVSILVGVSSDTFDVLGRVSGGIDGVSGGSVEVAVRALPGVHRLPLPAYSAYKVRGKSLHAWAAAGRIHEVEVPVREMLVSAVEWVGADVVPAGEVVENVQARFGRVRGEFRQVASLADWGVVAGQRGEFARYTFRLTVSSGTYVRAIVNDLAGRLGCSALLYTLVRTRVGPWTWGQDDRIRI